MLPRKKVLSSVDKILKQPNERKINKNFNCLIKFGLVDYKELEENILLSITEKILIRITYYHCCTKSRIDRSRKVILHKIGIKER